MSGYRGLKVWQDSVALAKQVYLDTESFPKTQLYSLTQQMQRAAVSIASNIAEGHNRNSTKEYIHFLGIALGSAGELETQYFIAADIGFIEHPRASERLELISEIARMLRAVIKTLQKQIAA